MNLVLALLLLELVHSALGTLPVLHHVHEKFEYKYGFKGPYIVNSKGKIPYWNHGGSAIPSDESVRVCPSIKSRKGSIWTKESFDHKHWMVDVELRVTGRLKTGADGMAIWFTEQPLSEGAVFGAQDTWKGLGVFLDSFDNDGLSDNPKIQVVLNDGTRRYEHFSDGLRNEVGSCLRDFRNRPYPVKLRIYYLRNTLEVWVHDGVSLVEDDYQLCAKVEGKSELGWIPLQGYFGATAATGGLSDDHDITKFITHSIVPYEEKTEEIRKLIDEEEAKTMEEEYHKKAAEFDQRRDEYREKQQPGEGGGSMDWQQEMEIEQNMRLVADVLIQLQRQLGRMDGKMDSLLAMRRGEGGQGLQQTSGGGGGGTANDIIQLQTTSSQILHQLADLRASVERSAPAGAKVATSEQMQPIYETKNTVLQNTKQLEAIQIHLRDMSGHKCPLEEHAKQSSSSCLSPWLFLVAMVIQLVVILGYMIHRTAQERNAKKFF